MRDLDGQSSLNPLKIFLDLRHILIILVNTPRSIRKTCLLCIWIITELPEILNTVLLCVLLKNLYHK